MLFVSLIRWWYGLGWFDQLKQVRKRFDRTADFFSIGLTLKTFFQPFKQIDAGSSRRGSFDVMLRSLFDQLFSRVFGAVVRFFLIIAGIFALAVEAVVGLVRLIVWPLAPILPVISIPFVISGWIPWQ